MYDALNGVSVSTANGSAVKRYPLRPTYLLLTSYSIITEIMTIIFIYCTVFSAGSLASLFPPSDFSWVSMYSPVVDSIQGEPTGLRKRSASHT
ncbi:hypothetical protein BDN72DRAFT_66369 [Pluteus cervinus]|uniref:Uncharacterized protein n=1 Tax=Pluteus cervinus TaxID=181527 RepID=A0ACD3ARW0_9AGAR|nr:hypothetical protein BDN72DRAFT_66369 [Pluteus cervinus]